jgi:hypothetical protein
LLAWLAQARRNAERAHEMHQLMYVLGGLKEKPKKPAILRE